MAWIDYFKTLQEQLAMLISGTTEAGAAIPGPPVQLKVGSQAPQLDDTDKLAVSLYGKSSAAGDTPLLVLSSGILRVNVCESTGNELVTIAGSADGFSEVYGGIITAAEPRVFNGVTWDRVRGPTELALLAAAARTATVSSADQTNWNWRGALVALLVTAVTDTPALTLSIEGKFGTQYIALLTATVAVATAVNSLYVVMPGVGSATAGVTQVSGFALPRTWRVTVTHGDTDSATYSVVGVPIL